MDEAHARTMPPNAEADSTAAMQALRREVAELRARLDAFERILQLRDAAGAPSGAPLPAAPPAAPLPADYDIAADQLLPAQDGFHQLEWGPDGPLRWTGPTEDVHFEAWIDRSAPLVATLRLFHFGTPANAKDLTLVVDGASHAMRREGTTKILVSAPIAPRAGDGPTRFTLHVPHLHSPSARGAADKRVLGVAFQRLTVARG